MSQEELATRSGVAQAAMARVEQNKRLHMRSDELGRIVEALDAPADELLGIRDFKGVSSPSIVCSHLPGVCGTAVPHSTRGAAGGVRGRRGRARCGGPRAEGLCVPSLTRLRRLYALWTLPCPCRWGILALEAAPVEAVWS